MFNIVIEVLLGEKVQLKENKGTKMSKDDVKLSILADGIIVYIGKSQISIRKLVQLKNTFSKVTEYKIN